MYTTWHYPRRKQPDIYRAADTELIVNQLMSKHLCDALRRLCPEHAYGTAHPVVRGMWNFNRINPAARANEPGIALLRFEHRTEKAFEDPLFHVENSFNEALHLRYTRYGEWHAQ